jgi:hypothetical protein
MIVTKEMLESKLDELTDMLEEYEGDGSEFALDACKEIVSTVAESRFEGIGILNEAMIGWREESLSELEGTNSDLERVFCDPENPACPECAEKAKRDIDINLDDMGIK